MPEEIGQLTLPQFSSLIYQLSRKLNWEVQVAAIPVGNKIEPDHHPLHPSKEETRRRQREVGAPQDERSKQVSFESFAKALKSYVKH